jgi:hypothetical protein
MPPTAQKREIQKKSSIITFQTTCAKSDDTHPATTTLWEQKIENKKKSFSFLLTSKRQTAELRLFKAKENLT